MITVASVIENIVKRTPFMEDLLNNKLINYSAFARHYHQEVEQKTLKLIKYGAIVMALKRMVRKKKTLGAYNQFLQNPKEVIARSNLFEVTIKTSKITDLIKKTYQLKQKYAEYFFTITEGVFETTLIASCEIKKEIIKSIKPFLVISEINNLASITLRLKEDNIITPGVYYQILKKLYWENINIIEVVSTTNEITLIIAQSDLEKAFSAIGGE